MEGLCADFIGIVKTSNRGFLRHHKYSNKVFTEVYYLVFKSKPKVPVISCWLLWDTNFSEGSHFN